MWNPNAYRDTDYGLVEDELFEPIDDDGDDCRPGPNEPFVQSVLGPVPIEEVGLALMREHLQRDPPPGMEQDIDGRLNDSKAALLDLEAFFTVNGRTVVSATPKHAGRNATTLLWLVQHAPVHIVAAAGFPARDYLARVYQADAAERMRDDLEWDLTDGMDGTGALPGILTVSFGAGDPSPLERHAIALVGDAHRRFGLPVMISTTTASDWSQLTCDVVEAGVAPGQIIMAGMTAVDDRGVLDDLARTGAFLLFDGLASGQDLHTARTILRLIADGYGDHILLSHGYTRRSRLTGYGGRPGLSYVVEHFAVMLLEEGLDALQVRSILVANAGRALSVRRGPQLGATT